MQPIRFVKKPKTKFKGKFCSTPFTDLSVDDKNQYTLCRCQHYMSFVIGNDKLSQAWNSDLARQVRQSVIEGTFDYCSWSCPGLDALTDLPKTIPDHTHPRLIALSNDRSCNLRCPSCREKVIIEKDPMILDRQSRIVDDILRIDSPVIVDPCNNGEPFVSPAAMYFLRSLEQSKMSKIKIYFSTNGTLIYHYRDLIESLLPRIVGFSISIDAATQSTYHKVRGEHWQDLIQGIEWLKTKNVVISARFVVQQSNYQEIIAFSEMCRFYGFHDVHFQKLRDWGHWSDSWWNENMLTKSQFEQAKFSIQNLQASYPDLIVADREFLA